MIFREEVSACYDHLSGKAGELITERLIEMGWVTPDPNPGVTPEGWAGFAGLGLNLIPLTTSRRRAVAYCTEQDADCPHEHLGGHLGALVRQHFLERGWLERLEGKLHLTAEGKRVLDQLGINLEEEP